MIRAAVIGLGDIAPVHLDAINALPGAVLAAGCDIDPSRRVILPDGVPFYQDYRELLRREQPDIVHLCLPHDLHCPVGTDAARLGVHVFTEKPLGVGIPACEAFAALERELGVKIGICLQNRLNPTTEALLAILRNGACGPVKSLLGVVAWSRTREYYAAKPWRASLRRSGSGVMMNQAVHTIDLLQYLAGSSVETVRGLTGHLADFQIECEDTACARIAFRSGASAVLLCTVVNGADSSVWIEVRCENDVFTLQNRRLTRQDGLCLAEDESASTGKLCYGNSHQKAISMFYSAVENGTEEYIRASEGLAALRIIEAIQTPPR